MKVERKTYKIICTEPLLGTVPANMNIRDLLKIAVKPDEQQKLEATALGKDDDSFAATHTVFFKDEEGIYICNYQFKGFLKEAGNNLKKSLKIAALRDKLSKFVFVQPRWIWIAKEIDGVLERPIRGMTARGERIALATSEVVYNAQFEVTIEILSNPYKIDFKIIETLLDYGAFFGLGRWRGGEFGRFVWEAVEEAN